MTHRDNRRLGRNPCGGRALSNFKCNTPQIVVVDTHIVLQSLDIDVQS